ncbi:Uncharacterized protein At3g17950 [Linum perenne]
MAGGGIGGIGGEKLPRGKGKGKGREEGHANQEDIPPADGRRRKWWSLCRDAEAKPASLGEFLEVERRYGDAAFFNDEYGAAAAEIEGGTRGRALFADGRVLPPAEVVVGGGSSSAVAARGAISRFPVSLLADSRFRY